LWYPKITLFIDGTFSVVPKPFSQCLIVMAFELAVNVYVPIGYVLVQSKSQDTYWRVLNELIMLSNRQLEPV
jgi:cell shape-determining protein MreD